MMAQPTLQEQGKAQTVPWGLGTRWAGAGAWGLADPRGTQGGVRGGEGADSSSYYGPGPTRKELRVPWPRLYPFLRNAPVRDKNLPNSTGISTQCLVITYNGK